MKTACIALALLSFAACALPKMAVNPDLAPGAQEPFERDFFGPHHVKFGPFVVVSVDRSAFEGSGSVTSSILFPTWLKSLGEVQKHQDYAFDLSEDGQAARSVRCRADMSGSQASFGRFKMNETDERLHCAWLAGDSPELGRLDLANGSGQIAFAGHSMTLEARDLHGSKTSFNPAGFAVVDGSRDIGEFQIANGGAAWIAPGLEPALRTGLAVVGAALLLYQPPSKN